MFPKLTENTSISATKLRKRSCLIMCFCLGAVKQYLSNENARCLIENKTGYLLYSQGPNKLAEYVNNIKIPQ